MKITAPNAIKRELIELAGLKIHGEILNTNEQIEACYSKNEQFDTGALQDTRNDFREGQEETGIQALFSRNCETKSVAYFLKDGTWVGWTYYYGGGKHSYADEIEWVENAYYLECDSVERVVEVKVFTKSKRERLIY
tara:strand:- start:89485 stop:89895 length:411 start_codon:yes stop_codon:yes gene_type:complete